MPATAMQYTVHLDQKNRFTLRGAVAKYYTVQVFKDQHILLSPRKLVADPPISAATRRQIARSVENLKASRTAGVVDVDAARKLFDK